MKGQQKTASIICLVLTGLLASCHHEQPHLDQVTGIELIKNEVVLSDSLTGGKVQLTDTGQKIEAILVSSDRKYVACEKQIATQPQAGIFEEGEEIPLVSVCSILIYKVDERRLVREIKSESEESPFLRMNEWQSETELSYFGAGQFDVTDIFIYNIADDVIINTDYNFQPRLRYE